MAGRDMLRECGNAVRMMCGDPVEVAHPVRHRAAALALGPISNGQAALLTGTYDATVPKIPGDFWYPGVVASSI